TIAVSWGGQMYNQGESDDNSTVSSLPKWGEHLYLKNQRPDKTGTGMEYANLGPLASLAQKAFMTGPYRKGEVIIRAGSDEELAALLKRAQEEGGEMVDLIPGLRAARLRFTDPASMNKFLQGGTGGFDPELNYTVSLPTPPPPPDPSAPGSLVPFGSGALSYLGVPVNNSGYGKGVEVAMLDTGLSPGETNLLRGGSVTEVDLVGGSPPDPGHGDMVATLFDGTLADQGISPGVSLLSVRVLDSNNTGDVFTVAEGLMQAVQDGAKIINMSLGTSESSSILEDAVSSAEASGVVLVAAVGNDGVGEISYPAAYDGVVAVGAVDATGQRATFSNYGPQITFVAPGVGLNSQTAVGAVSFSGTSAAAPLVTGMISDLMSNDPSLTAAQAVSIMETHSNFEGPVTTPGTNTNEYYGYGVPNLTWALNRNNSLYGDVALADTFLDVDGIATASNADGSATAPLQIVVQNRGNTSYPVVQLNVNVNNQPTQYLLKGLGPDQVQAVTLNVGVGQLLSGGVIVNAAVQTTGADVNPNDNAVSRLLHVTPAGTVSINGGVAPAPVVPSQ
ncbi:MAG: S8 family serine peptidase, partial [Opitutales bacterium]